jgi:hypothetical protein
MNCKSLVGTFQMFGMVRSIVGNTRSTVECRMLNVEWAHSKTVAFYCWIDW